MRPLFVIFFLCSSTLALCQRSRVVDLIADGEYTLYGNASRSKPSRVVIPITDIPAHTTEITYSVRTNKKIDRVHGEDVAGLMLAGKYGGPAAHAPNHVQPIPVFLLPGESDARLFVTYSDSAWNSYTDYNNDHCVNCKVFVSWPLENCTHPFLAIENPLPRSKVKFTVNVTAIVSR